MFKKFIMLHNVQNSLMKNPTSLRNQVMNLQCKSTDWFRPDMGLHRKGLLNSPEYNKKILSKHTRKI